MKKINLNKFAKTITIKEGGKVNLTVAQVKEVLRLTFTELAIYCKPSQIMEVIERYT